MPPTCHFVLFASALALGCAGRFPHDFSPTHARDYEQHSCTKTESPEARAVLLIPANTELTQPPRPGGGDNSLGVSPRKRYRGPARIFLWPGHHFYWLQVTTEQGFAELELNIPVKARERYLLEVAERPGTVTTSVLRLSDEDYRKLYP